MICQYLFSFSLYSLTEIDSLLTLFYVVIVVFKGFYVSQNDVNNLSVKCIWCLKLCPLAPNVTNHFVCAIDT